MPRCGSQIMFCDVPIRLDTYVGCGFMCGYCNERIRLRAPATPSILEGLRSLRNFINGKRAHDTNWCDWDIPLHWGGISDPFQPCEEQYHQSLKMLKLFAEAYYPIIISTKSTLLIQREYLTLLRKCDVVVQVSMCSPTFGCWERHAPSFRDRLAMLYHLSRHTQRVIVRVQPYMPEIKSDVLKYLPVYAASGVHGITIEGLHWHKKRKGLTEKWGNWMCYPLETLAADFIEIRSACHENRLRFYCAENRLRYLGDSPTCCGCDGIPGFRVNVANMNYPMPIEYTKKMRKSGTGGVFRALARDTQTNREYSRMSYKNVMELRIARAIEDFFGPSLSLETMKGIRKCV